MKKRVTLEPELEIQVLTLNAEERRRLARIYFRRAKQLFVSAHVLDLDAGVAPARRRPAPAQQCFWARRAKSPFTAGKMKRGVVTKERSKLVNLWVPKDFVSALDKAVVKLDTDRSKFIRNAMREKLATAGISIPEEAA